LIKYIKQEDKVDIFSLTYLKFCSVNEYQMGNFRSTCLTLHQDHNRGTWTLAADCDQSTAAWPPTEYTYTLIHINDTS